MIATFLISDIVWNRLTTIGCFTALFAVIFSNSRGFANIRKKILADKISDFEKISQIMHSDHFALNAYMVTNTEGIIKGANQRMQKMFGWTEDELKGCKIEKIVHQSCLKDLEIYQRDHSSEDDDTTIEIEGQRKDGIKMNLEVNVGKWNNDISWYYTFVIRDVSHRRRNEQTVINALADLNRLRELYHEGEKIGNVAFWILDVRTGLIDPSSPNFGHLFGVGPGPVKVELLIKRVANEDKIRVAATMTVAKESKSGYDMEYRMNGWDDYINTIRSIASAVKNKKGELTHYIGMAQLIKKEKAKWL